MNSRTNLRQFVAHLCGWSSAATLRHTPTSGSLCQLIILCSPLCIASQIDTQPALVVFWLRICCDPSCVLLSGTAAVCPHCAHQCGAACTSLRHTVHFVRHCTEGGWGGERGGESEGRARERAREREESVESAIEREESERG
jgi:hypothetical protein